MNNPTTSTSFHCSKYTTGLALLILLISFVLRGVLILRGGQFYFPDEERYQVSRLAAKSLMQFDWWNAGKILSDSADHLGFKAIGIIPAMIENLFGPNPHIPAFFFSLFSVFNLVLIWKIANQSGANASEANYALFLGATSQVLLYYSRHLLPYDLALFFGLLGIYLGLVTRNKATSWSIMVCGLFGFLTFVIYNGYWTLSAFTSLVCIGLPSRQNITNWLKILALWLIGFCVPLILELGISFFLGNNLTANYLQFSQTVTQGDYSEGWSLPWEYFWHAEGGLLVILLVLVLIALISTPQLNDRLRLYLTGLLFIYICLVIPSVVTHSFVVYGRLARQMMPFLVLIAAFGLQQMFFFSHYGRYFFSISVGLCVVFAGFRYADAFQQIYPLEFAEEAQIRYAQFRISNAAIDFRSPTLCMKGNYIAANVKYIYPSPETLPDIQGDLLMSDPHPMNFIPYLYEGYTPQQRQNFLDKRVMMYLYTIKPGSLPKTEVPILSCVP